MTVRCIERDRDEMVRSIVEASKGATIVVAVMDEEHGQLMTSGEPSNSDLAFVGQVITHQAMREAWGNE